MGEKRKPRIIDLALGKPAVPEGASLQEELSQRTPWDSKVYQTTDQDGISEMSGGCVTTEQDPSAKMLPELCSGTAESMCAEIEQDPLLPELLS